MQQDFFISSDYQVLLDDDGVVEIYRNFLSGESFYERLMDEISWKELDITLYGKTHKVPRLTEWFADDSNKRYSYSGINLTPVLWTKTMRELKGKIEEKLGCNFNSCLANLYRQGSDYAAWHSDDEKELGSNPMIASLSIGETRRFVLKHKTDKGKETLSIDLEDGDLLVMKGALQKHWKHQLNKTSRTVNPRINLTFRNILD